MTPNKCPDIELVAHRLVKDAHDFDLDCCAVEMMHMAMARLRFFFSCQRRLALRPTRLARTIDVMIVAVL